MLNLLQKNRAIPVWQVKPYRIGQMATGRTVVVFNATNWAGQNTCRRLIDRGDRVIVISTNREKARFVFGPHVIVATSYTSVCQAFAVDKTIDPGFAGYRYFLKCAFHRLWVRHFVLRWRLNETNTQKQSGGLNARNNNARHTSSNAGWTEC